MPGNTCAYGLYDPDTLEPLNTDTYLRLKELGWTRSTFEGKEVLDIGCNSGLLTMYAVRLGASSVRACEVQDELAAFVAEVAERNQLPVTVSTAPFHKLDPDEHSADIVLFMEVLHWVVSQGMPLPNVITRLAKLTRETLYLEFPWSVAEPSIQAQTDLTEETYSADAVLDELTRYFTDVGVVGFMHYFGVRSRSKRVLVRASGKRPEADLLAVLPGAYSLDRSLSRGRNESYLLTSSRGLLAGKVLDGSTRVARLPDPLRDELFDRLHESEPQAIVLPEKVEGRYALPLDGGRKLMVFPYVGTPFSNEPPWLSDESVIELLADVRRDFRGIDRELLQVLRAEGLSLRNDHIGEADAPWRQGADVDLPVEEIDRFLRAHQTTPRLYDGLNHGDLHRGNFVAEEDGRYRVVDLESMVVGTIYSDGIMGLIWRGGPEELFPELCAVIGREETREARQADVVVAVSNGLRWFAVARSAAGPAVRPAFERFSAGVAAALRFSQTLPA
jgi:SAM-dependent methyltransferase